jgi:spermidine synthase
VNKDLTPYAVFEMLIFWNKQFSPKLALFLESLQDLNLKQIAIFVFIITLLIFFLLHSRPKLRKLNIAYCIFTTGFFAMLVNLILIFAFQVFYGYLYHMIGMLISIFMAGIALGSITMTRKINRIRGYMRLFIALEILILMFSFILPWAIIKFVELYAVLFLVSGFLIGAEFPLANKIYLEDKNKIGLTVGLLYAVDLTGGWCAGILGGIIFLPILGLLNTCIVIALLKLSSLIILVFYGEKFRLT